MVSIQIYAELGMKWAMLTQLQFVLGSHLQYQCVIQKQGHNMMESTNNVETFLWFDLCLLGFVIWIGCLFDKY